MASSATHESLTGSSSVASIGSAEQRPNFVHLDERYKCAKCKDALLNPMQTSCGHRICELCLDSLFGENQVEVMCPGGEEDCDKLNKNDVNSVFKDKSAHREMQRLEVYCSNKNYGCPKKMKWKELDKHSADCEYTPECCAFCGNLIPLIQTNHHQTEECSQRPVTCQYCLQQVPFSEYETHIDETCLGVQVDCPHKCGATGIKRGELEEHFRICQAKPAECPYRVYGCEFQGTQPEVKTHEDEDKVNHIHLLAVQLGRLELDKMEITRKTEECQNQLDALKNQVQSFEADNEQHKQTTENFEKKMKSLQKMMASHGEKVYKLEDKVEGVAEKKVVEDHGRQITAMKETQKNHEDRIVRIERGGGGGTGGNVGVSEALMNQLTAHDRQVGIHDVRLAEIDLRFQVLETASYDGILIWKIRDYTRRKHEATTGKTLSLYSQPFYTSRFGYKMCARVYLNGDGMGKGTHMSLFFVVMRGDYDALLQWPFRQKVTLMLLDQDSGRRHLSDTFRPDPTSSSFKKPTSEMNVASGCPLFVSQSVLESKTYVKDDTIFIKVIVDTADLYGP
ncbi:TNF receptor-associated factor 3-like [Lingula anatina]|uniref:TNF receptor-associated factor 3-like n=1 Tax=Lingula anatina TaxID=7574 RepID=A0A1S3HC32_LINAN|nr:TNF receptor-associated factor 3-like [Lingula anatina]|eukprot:XP_013383071.1 TNF receptor-associated factor 3-like [Lingula anatina]